MRQRSPDAAMHMGFFDILKRFRLFHRFENDAEPSVHRHGHGQCVAGSNAFASCTYQMQIMVMQGRA